MLNIGMEKQAALSTRVDRSYIFGFFRMPDTGHHRKHHEAIMNISTIQHTLKQITYFLSFPLSSTFPKRRHKAHFNSTH